MNDEVTKSILTHLQDRAVSPLLGAFVISWSLWNYKLVLAILAFIPLVEKIQFIEQVLYPTIWGSVIFLGVGPLTTCLIFLFLYPYPARLVFRFWRQKQKELRDIRLTIEDESLLTLEESKRIRKQVIEIQADYDKQIKKLEDDLERYKGELAKSEQEVARLKGELAKSEQEVARLDEKNWEAVPSAQELAAVRSAISDSELSDLIRRRPYRLQFNPKREKGGSKIMMFGPDGKILEGANNNEHSWRARDGMLELINSEGKVFSRFNFDPMTNLLLHTNDSDTLSLRGQYLVPELSAAQ